VTTATIDDDPLAYVRTVLGHISYRAAIQDRSDLVDRLERHQGALDRLEGATVVVVGLCDSGKSTLVNACVGRAVVPVDLVHPTPVPVVLKAGDGAVVVHSGDDDGGGKAMSGELDAVAAAFSGGRSHELRLVEIGCPSWTRPSSLVLVDTPSNSVGTAAARELLVGLDPDVLVVATDAGQELSQVEVATIAAAQQRRTQVVVVLTKIDLHPYWRRIREIDEGHLRQAGVTAPVVPISSRLHELGVARDDAVLRAEGGLASLLEIIDNAATGARESYLCARALDAVADATSELTAELQAQHDLLTDPDAARRANDELIRSRECIERLRGGGAKWRERLYDGLERLQLDTEHDLRTRMAHLQTDAYEEIETGDPTEIWPVFSARLERMVEAEVASVFKSLQESSRELAEDVARLFDDEGGLETTDMTFTNHSRVLEEVRMQVRLEDMEAGRGGSALNAVRGSAASLSVTAILARYGALLIGGAVLQVILLPLGAAMTLLLGHHAIRATRESRTTMQRRAATMAVRKYLDGVGPEVAVRMRSDLMSVRVDLRDHFERVAAAMASRVDGELRVALESMRASDSQRELRLASVAEELQQVQLVATHAARARALLADAGATA
jgi:hypothetical protein